MSLSLHDKNNNPLKCESSFEERLKKFKTIYAYTEEHEALTEKFSKEHGRAWWVFCSTQQVEKFKDQWIEQFRVKEERCLKENQK